MSKFEEARAALGAALDAEVTDGLGWSTPEELAGFGAALRERSIWHGDGGAAVCCVAEEVPHAAVAAGATVAVVASSAGSSPAEADAQLDARGFGVFAADVLCPPWARLRGRLPGPVAAAGVLLAPVAAAGHVVSVQDDELAEPILRALCRLDHRRAVAVSPGQVLELCDGAISELPDERDLSALCLYASWLAPTPSAGARMLTRLQAAA